jgi:error-prone DNA polymerase
MVHPYLRRRAGLEKVDYPSDELREVLERTLGVPLFQEQAMKIAMVAAGFSGAEADHLRRAMASFRRNGQIEHFREKFVAGMLGRNYQRDFAERCFDQIEGFSEYGFPLSHAASFALLVYVSAWMKRFHPDVFACALLNSQPMGFYAPAQIVRDAQERGGVEVRAVDVNHSDWECTLEPAGEGRCALRLGFRQVKGVAELEMRELLVAKRGSGFRSPAELRHRTGLCRAALERLADADAFRSLGLDRRQALWAVKGLEEALPASLTGAGRRGAWRASVGQGKGRSAQAGVLPLLAPLAGSGPAEPPVALPAMGLGEQVVQDYRVTGLSLKRHPLELLRDPLSERGIRANACLAMTPPGRQVRVAGLVLVRQQPGTASGVIFMTLEDETGIANLVVWRTVFERFRPIVMGGRLVECVGRVQREGEVIHVIAERLVDHSPLLQRLWDPGLTELPEIEVRSRDFR